MTVLLVNKYYHRRGGAEAHLLDLQALLESRAHRTAVFAMDHPANRPSEHSRFFARSSDYRAPSLGGRLSAAVRLVYNADARRRLEALLAVEPVEVAHLHNIYHQLSPSILPALARRGIPMVMTVHDLKLACPSYKMLAGGAPCERCRGGRYYHAALARCHEGSAVHGGLLALEAYLHGALRSYARAVSAFLCPSRFYARKLEEHGIPPARLEVVPYFLDARAYEPTYEPGEGVLYFGRLSPEKGLPTVIRALGSLPGATLTLVGEGPQRAELEALAAPLGGRVVFAGRLDGRALQEAVRKARVCVLASEWYENLPVSVIEAFALGRAVVGARIGGIPELVDPGRTGWLFEPGDAASLAAALDEALGSARLGEMGREARRFVETRLSPDAFYGRLRSVYARARQERPS